MIVVDGHRIDNRSHLPRVEWFVCLLRVARQQDVIKGNADVLSKGPHVCVRFLGAAELVRISYAEGS